MASGFILRGGPAGAAGPNDWASASLPGGPPPAGALLWAPPQVGDLQEVGRLLLPPALIHWVCQQGRLLNDAVGRAMSPYP